MRVSRVGGRSKPSEKENGHPSPHGVVNVFTILFVSILTNFLANTFPPGLAKIVENNAWISAVALFVVAWVSATGATVPVDPHHTLVVCTLATGAYLALFHVSRLFAE